MVVHLESTFFGVLKRKFMYEDRRIEAIWGVKLLDEGFLSIPNILVRNYRKLGIEHGEWGLICTILTYKHDTRDPYPSQETLAEHLGVSRKQIEKWTKSLHEKGLVLIGQRRNVNSKKFGNAVYNFRPLIDAALSLVGEKPLPSQVQNEWNIEYKKPSELEVGAAMEPQVGTEPEVGTALEPQVGMESEPQVRTNRSLEYTHENNLPTPTLLNTHLHEYFRSKLAEQSYDTWFRDSEIVSLSDGIIYIRTISNFSASWIKSHYETEIIQLANNMGVPATTVQAFVADKHK